MSKFTIGLLTLAMYATALALVPSVTPVQAAANSAKHHIKKHKKNMHWSPGVRESWSSDQARPVARPSSQAGVSCARGFECGRWPPSIYDDPDRKASGTDH